MIGIVIPCRNQLEYTQQCVESLFASTVGDYRIILIDNECTDDTVRWVTERCAAHNIALDVIHRVGTNLSACWNAGISRAVQHKTDLVAILNNDVVVGAGWDCKFREHFAQRAETWLAVPECVGSANDEVLHNAVLELADCADFQISQEWFPGYFMVFRTAVFASLGLFNENYRIWYGDTDMRHRLNAAGYPAVMLRVPIVHFGSKTTGTVPAHGAIIDEDRRYFRGVYGYE